MNANTTPFSANAPRTTARATSRVATTSPTRALRGTPAAEEKSPQPLPLVLAVLPLRQVVREGRTVSRHA